MTFPTFHYRIRPLNTSDSCEDYLYLLSQLTTVGDITEAEFKTHLQLHIPPESIFVIEDKDTNRLIATGKLLVEHKFVHGCGKVGHIEDIVVLSSYRGHGLGKIMIQYLTQLAKETGCYKVILDCKEENVGFYERCGFKRNEVQMAQYFE